MSRPVADRRVGHDTTSLPLILLEPLTRPIVRVETSPLGSWRLLQWKSDADRDALAGPCAITFEERVRTTCPSPVRRAEQELKRRGRH